MGQREPNSKEFHSLFCYLIYVMLRRWKDNIRMDLEDICINEGNWVDLAQDRDYWRAHVNAALNLQVP